MKYLKRYNPCLIIDFTLSMHTTSIKALLIGTSGTILQWYDFYIFSYFASIIATLYFPQNNYAASLMSAFGVLAVGYLLSPLGALFFGYIGDVYGRKRALAFSILLMALATGFVSILPGFAFLGLLAPILLTLLRMVQGFVASGEYTGSSIFLVEYAPSNKKAFYGCLTSSAYSLGAILAGLSASFFTASFMPDWAWRGAFVVSVLGAILVYIMRRSIDETPEYKQIRLTKKTKKPFLTALKERPLAILGVIGIACLVGIMTYGTYVFMVSYLHHYFKLSLSTSALIITGALALDALFEPFIAILADKIGYLKIICFGMLALFALSIPLFNVIATQNLINIVFAVMTFSLLIAITCAPLNAYMLSLFPQQYRYSGFGVAFHIGMSIFGSTAPLAMTWLFEHTHHLTAPAWYFMVAAVIGFLSLSICEKSKTKVKAYNFLTSESLERNNATV